jgi:hypothetical protein
MKCPKCQLTDEIAVKKLEDLDDLIMKCGQCQTIMKRVFSPPMIEAGSEPNPENPHRRGKKVKAYDASEQLRRKID